MHISFTYMFLVKICIGLDLVLGGEPLTKGKELIEEYRIEALRFMGLSIVSGYLPYLSFKIILLIWCKELYFLFYDVLN